MECSAIRLIPPNGRRLIFCIRISTKRQEILGLDFPLMDESLWQFKHLAQFVVYFASNYNLALWLVMKRKYMMLSMMISSPRQPRNDIDVYLSPIIEVLTKVWDEEVVVFDGYEMRHSSCMQCYFVPLMTFQHTKFEWIQY